MRKRGIVAAAGAVVLLSGCFGDGTFVIGTAEGQVNPGVYAAPGGSGCYWARLSGFAGTLAEVIASDFGHPNGMVTVAPTDKGVTSSRCGTWDEVDPNKPRTEDRNAVGDGTWRVGIDIAHGIWQAPGDPSCYWERLAGFSGQFEETIQNDFGAIAPIVYISASDVGFKTERCGQWTRIADLPLASPVPIAITGSGNTVTGLFILSGGLTVVHGAAPQVGSFSSFGATLLNEAGERVTSLWFEIDAFDGTTALTVPPGKYRIEVDADGPWQIDIAEPRNQPAAPLPVTYSGTGSAVIVGPFTASGAIRIAASHQADGLFSVVAFSAPGSRLSTWIFETDPFSGETTESVPWNSYYLAVEPTGPWSLSISQL